MGIQIPDVFDSFNRMEKATSFLRSILLDRLEGIAEEAGETADKKEKFRDPKYWEAWLKDPENTDYL